MRCFPIDFDINSLVFNFCCELIKYDILIKYYSFLNYFKKVSFDISTFSQIVGGLYVGLISIAIPISRESILKISQKYASQEAEESIKEEKLIKRYLLFLSSNLFFVILNIFINITVFSLFV
jgi:hypothetical protein